MNRWLWQFETALVITLGAWVGPLAAQEVPQNPGSSFATENQGVKPAYAQVPVIPHLSTPPDAPPPAPPESGLIRKWWFNTCNCAKDCANRMGYCCSSSHNDLGCGNFESDLVFIFGSCRQYFTEPCMQYPVPAPPGVPRNPGPAPYPSGVPFGGPYSGTSGSNPYP